MASQLPTKCSLLNIPVDILQEILEVLVPRPCSVDTRIMRIYGDGEGRGGGSLHDVFDNMSALRPLSLSCRDLNQLTAPLIYQRITLTLDSDENYLFWAVRHLSQHPEHALHVKQVVAFGSGASISKGQQADFIRGLAVQLLGTADTVPPDRRTRPDSLLIAFLLSLTVNVEKVHLANPAAFSLDRFLPRGLSLAALETLVVDMPLDKITFFVPRVALFPDGLAGLVRRSPALRAVKLENYQAAAAATSGRPAPSKRFWASVAHISCLHLDKSFLTAADLARVVKACPRLESFRYRQYSTRGQRLDAPRHFTSGELSRVFLPLKATLTQLDLELSGITHRRLTPGGENSYMLDLKPYAALELLCVTATALGTHALLYPPISEPGSSSSSSSSIGNGNGSSEDEAYAEDDEDGYPEDIKALTPGSPEHKCFRVLAAALPAGIVSVSITGLGMALAPAAQWLAHKTRAGRFPRLRYFWYISSGVVDNALIAAAFASTQVDCRGGCVRGWTT
ncbi:hypothetical protein B0T24DRAFT_364029 [Lasiosphaeria ovina]|uniref:Uncharacterized protein n=1 Tax=Lasiosphaeria ovina TaxID=92902 RepID=A0AAE0K433_9PEZI|nr:hypothetical protein B0T24DRAFT_364029 [Lasiosphaeria ovina]